MQLLSGDGFDWLGAVASSPRAVAAETLLTAVARSHGGSGAFLGITTTGRRFWIKVIGNPQGDDVLAAEQIVAAAGGFLGAPVCRTALIDVPRGLDFRYSEWRRVPAGVAHGSLALTGELEECDLVQYPESADNALRIARLAALWDWCMGTDPQWIYTLDENRRIHSFDHGNWLSGETGWTGGGAVAARDLPYVLPGRWRVSVVRAHLASVAQDLLAMTEKQCVDIVSTVPGSWPILDTDLADIASILHSRRRPVADRLLRVAEGR